MESERTAVVPVVDFNAESVGSVVVSVVNAESV